MNTGIQLRYIIKLVPVLFIFFACCTGPKQSDKETEKAARKEKELMERMATHLVNDRVEKIAVSKKPGNFIFAEYYADVHLKPIDVAHKKSQYRIDISSMVDFKNELIYFSFHVPKHVRVPVYENNRVTFVVAHID